ncbi:SulP family inorganic anion transporter [Hyphomicrobium sp.]|jgi:SulP family sulfate permease|uniref:SulP family inorganic anion transporter n=1 Tax=Hyphomicrobium sp. TaxID=82 RepID=UPI002B9BB58A|nr:SulP family inorganic anion transporter [Hyphomicrobium sp.]HVZ03432.1 SulP family inorganic anion transporter [Hyphomicrobium sp.]
MDTSVTVRPKRSAPTLAELFTPKLVTVLREGYTLADFRADFISGLTVAIVALPLSMAIAIGSGLSPEKGLFTAVVGGFLISALGGSRYQIGGPAGAFIVLIASIVERKGYDGLVLATAMAGLIMIAAGFLRLGTYIKYIPYPVTVGFTAGIAVIIFASQVKDLLGLDILHEPAALIAKTEVILANLPSIRPATVFISLLSIGLIVGVRRIKPKWPGMLIAVTAAAILTGLLHLDVATIGSRFGEVPRMLPAPHLPELSLAKLRDAFPDAISIALLGAIESLLSAVVADGMSGRKHRSNCELVAQGVGNFTAVLFGGMCVTGTIARTATNIRSGARGPISGILHAAFVLLFMLVAAPLAAYIPLASLGGVLTVVAWNMAEKNEFASLLRGSWGDAAVLLATFLLTIFVDLTTAIAVGVTLGAFLFLHRMAEAVAIETGRPLIADDTADGLDSTLVNAALPPPDNDVMIYRISGAFFFGATASVSTVLDRIGVYPKTFILDFADVPLVDSTAARTLEGFAHKLDRAGTAVYFTSARKSIRRTLINAGLKAPLVRYAANIEDALAAARQVRVEG